MKEIRKFLESASKNIMLTVNGTQYPALTDEKRNFAILQADAEGMNAGALLLCNGSEAEPTYFAALLELKKADDSALTPHERRVKHDKGVMTAAELLTRYKNIS